MNICHLSTLHDPLDVRVFHKQCRTLAAAGHEVHLVVNAPPERAIDGVTFHDFGRPQSGVRPVRVWRRLQRAYEAARAIGAEVYHFHDLEVIPVGIALKNLGAQVVYDVHEDATLEPYSVMRDRPLQAWLRVQAGRALELAARVRFDRLVCATPAIAERFRGDRTVLVQNFPRLEEYTLPAAGATREPGRMIYAGLITGIRGTAQMLEGLSRVDAALAPSLTLCGTFGDAGLETASRAGPAWERVRYLGRIGRAELAQELAQAQVGLVLFQPVRDHIDALPNKMFEYMAAGLPVVVSDFPLWRSIVEAAGCGVCVDPANPDAIAAGITRILTDPAQARSMGERGRAAVESTYNWEHESRALLAMYDALAAEAGRST